MVKKSNNIKKGGKKRSSKRRFIMSCYTYLHTYIPIFFPGFIWLRKGITRLSSFMEYY